VLFGSVGFIVGSVVRDVTGAIPRARARGWNTTDPLDWTKRMAPFGGVLGIAALILRAAGVS
jgi:hypothetical protein